jgi:pullulanase-type alpha-1,6-glucosidase
MPEHLGGVAVVAPVPPFPDLDTDAAANPPGVPIVTVPGTHQSEQSGISDWDPAHLGSWLRDRDQDGVFTLTTYEIPQGSYQAKVAHGRSWAENYGAGGELGGDNIAFSVPARARTTFRYDLATHLLTVRTAPAASTADLAVSTAHWLQRGVLAWNLQGDTALSGWTFRLHHSRAGGLGVSGGVLTGGASIPLTADPAGLPPEIAQQWPHLANDQALRLTAQDAADRALLTGILRGQLAIAAYDETGQLILATGIQIPGVLDDLFDATGRALGVSWDGPVPALAVWAPTAQDVRLRITPPGAGSELLQLMSMSDADGVWSVAGDPGWRGASYRYEVSVYVPAADAVLTSLVTDPYSVALTTNSERSVIVDLTDASLTPIGWQQFTPPPLEHPVDSAIYELHVRDFSADDPAVPPAHRGGYLAFTDPAAAGLAHLAALAAAGLTAVHLLPTFDFSTVDDVKTSWQLPPCSLVALSAADPSGTAQQACVMAAADHDGFNWGYDPWHYNVPEGSYATDPEGPVRTLEFRQLVAALGDLGLRVVLDVVYNHTVASGQHPRSVLDRIVPGYYHRLSATGEVENSTCCANTAAEHAMMTKLIVDSVLLWARQYKVGGFRFDLMGHHPKATMLAVRSALDSLTVAADGVDGRSLHLYGEGWDFGEVAGNARFVQATQTELAGTGIGTFNDRLRDAVRGGGPFDEDPRVQGFGTGLFTDPNGATVVGPPVMQRDALLSAQDRIKVGLTGNLRDYVLIDRFGAAVPGSQVWHAGSPTGYTAEPSEVVSYVDAHDNETLFDALAIKLPTATTMADRVRMNSLCLATVALGQGPMLWHAGTDLLRSKSLDRNSFNSGDWFNRVDWSGQQSTFGSGLPQAADNKAKWPYYRPLLARTELRPGPADIADARAAAMDLLRLRASSRLFRLGSAALIGDRLHFPDGGPDQAAGVIVMIIEDGGSGAAPGADLDPERDRLVVIFNATPWWQTATVPAPAGLVLHPVQQAGLDPIVRLTSIRPEGVNVPPRTVVVLQS